MRSIRSTYLFIILCLAIFSCKQNNTNSESESNIKLYHGGDIITMHDKSVPNYVEAIAIDDDKIVFTGNKEMALEKFEEAKMIDLEEKTLIPGFVDAHSNIWQSAQKLGTINLDPESAGDITNIKDIVAKLNKELNENPSSYDEENEWLIG